MDVYDIRHGKKDLEFLATKVVHYQHNFKFLEAYEKLKIVPNGLRIKKTPCIRLKDDAFLETWHYTLKNAEMELISMLKDQNRKASSFVVFKVLSTVTQKLILSVNS